jgi:hypothetical protein
MTNAVVLECKVPTRRREGGERVGKRMDKAKEITPAEEIMITTEEIMAEAKEEAKEAPSKLRQKLHDLEAMWERASTQFLQAPKL